MVVMLEVVSMVDRSLSCRRMRLATEIEFLFFYQVIPGCKVLSLHDECLLLYYILARSMWFKILRMPLCESLLVSLVKVKHCFVRLLDLAQSQIDDAEKPKSAMCRHRTKR